MPGPVFPRVVWRGMTDEELFVWRRGVDRMLDVAVMNVRVKKSYYPFGKWDNTRLGWYERLKKEITCYVTE